MIEFSVFSVFSVAKNQSKTLIPQSKNQIFQNFLTHFPKRSYERRATRNGYIFVSNMQLRLIIEALALEFTLDVSSLAFLSGASGNKQLIIYVPIRPSQPRRPRQLTNVADPPSYGGNHEL